MKITAEMYQKNKDRYVLVSGFQSNAPTCPYGNRKKWVGYDLETQTYVRFTPSVFKKLLVVSENKPNV